MIEALTTLADPRLDPYTRLSDSALQRAGEVFIAESPKVIRLALDAGYTPVSLLAERRHLEGDAADIVARLHPDIPIFTGERRLLATLTGYTLTRGVLCAMRRPQLPTIADLCRPPARRLAVLHGVCDTTNVGAIFRSAAALGLDGVLLAPGTCDPLNRRSLRVSMGTVLKVPWTWGDPRQLAEYGFAVAALALTDRSLSLDHPAPAAEPRLAIMVGTEGDGLPQDLIDAAHYTLRIPMARSIDSLNVAAAAAIAFWQLL